MKTRDRIIHSSLELFNEHGERAITTNHIAAHLGISPGNLYYHFRNKQDIIQSIFKLFENHTSTSFQPYKDHNVNIELLIKYFDAMFYALWQFRFFYANINDILNKDDELKLRYHKMQQQVLMQAEVLIRQLITDGLLEVAEEDIKILADTSKMIMASWIGYRLSSTKNATLSKADLYEGVLRVILVVKGYATNDSKSTFESIEQHYKSLIAEQ
ncbi:MAG: TetR/AcrR family transcriptional regulator [Parashewanella sp.]